LLAVEIAVTMTQTNTKLVIGCVFLLIALIFVYRSFYGMRIPETDTGSEGKLVVGNLHKG
jgi:K(+)-stimulated pyrophosphate-energized sodium pump